MALTLHSYWRSSASYRVRIALNLKGLDYAQVTHDLRTGAHEASAYAALNPQQMVPALETDGGVIAQSLAILEWLEERYPEPSLLPGSAQDRAVVRAMAATIACDIHPLNNLRILKSLRQDLNATPEQINAWAQRWIRQGFAALEAMIARHDGTYAFGDTPTLADCCLVPQVYSAERFETDLTPYPRLMAAVRAAQGLPAVAAAHPTEQPDAD
ncbi:MAG TPA: maleylacetoacetate isomerase [Pedomonas sp.]|uniref:maleylacetoacetate isomerase n=1 Tax=Pedomonas sp. TaxID=2976421 RepID=UPI002F423E3D